MNNWADSLIREYEIGRRDLGEKKRKLDTKSIHDKQDISKINSMMDTMTESIEWMTTGREPNKLRGVDKKAVYQRRTMADMDMFPSLDIVPKERELDEEEKEFIFNLIAELSPRERQCFILHKAYMMSYAEIANELKLGKSTVQKYIERAKDKFSINIKVRQSL